jgi:hypothetical protein
VGALASINLVTPIATTVAADSKGHVTILYGTFGKDAAVAELSNHLGIAEIGQGHPSAERDCSPQLFSSTFIQLTRMVIYRHASARRRSFKTTC